MCFVQIAQATKPEHKGFKRGGDSLPKKKSFNRPRRSMVEHLIRSGQMLVVILAEPRHVHLPLRGWAMRSTQGTLGPAHASAPSPHVGELRMPKREFPKIKGTRVPYFNFGGPYNKDPTNEGATLNKRVPFSEMPKNFSRVAFPSRSSRARANQPPALWPMRMTGSPPESTVSSTFALARSKYHP